jgi:hypothetical protein
MKKYILFIVLALISVSAGAQDLYVYSVIGKVEKKVDNEWQPLRKREKLLEKDIVRVLDNSALSIMDRQNEKVYSVSKTSEKAVQDIIGGIKDKQGSVSGQLFSHMSKSLFNGEADKITHTAAGCTYRGDIIENDIAKTIFAKQKGDSIQKIDNANTDYAVAFELIGRNNNRIITNKAAVEEQAFFRIKNNSDKPLYVNVLDIDSNGEMYVCLPTDDAQTMAHLLIPPHSVVDLKEYPIEFTDPKGEDCLLLIATEVPFDLRIINQYLQMELQEPQIAYPVGLYRKNILVN